MRRDNPAHELRRQSGKVPREGGGEELLKKSHLWDCKSDVMLLLMSSQATAALTLKEFKGAHDKWYTYFSAPSILTTVGKCLIPQTLHIQYHGVEEKFITECTYVTLKIKAFPSIQIKVLHETVNKQKTLPGLTKNSGIPWEINMYALSLKKK